MQCLPGRVAEQPLFANVANVAPFVAELQHVLSLLCQKRPARAGLRVLLDADFDEALQATNASPYGLQAGIFARDTTKIFHAYSEIQVGGLIVNDVPTYRADHMPYGGVKDSGFGREGIRYAMEEMSELHVLALKLD